jgi:hypothetical protein
MNLRDQFAMSALPSLMTNLTSKDATAEAYKVADLMIAERERETGNVVLTQAEFRNLRGELIDCKAQIQAILEASKR